MFDLENLVQTFFCMTFYIVRLQSLIRSRSYLSILTFSMIEDIKNIKNKHVTLSVDLETQGHTLFFHMTLLEISGCMPAIYSILVSNLTYVKVEDLRKSIFGYLTLNVWPWFSRSNHFSSNLYYFQGQSLSDTLFISDFLSSLTSIMLKSILKSSLQHVFSQR